MEFKFDIKAATKFLKQEIAATKQNIINERKTHKEQQRLVAKIFFQQGMNPYQWWWKNRDGSNGYPYASKAAIPHQGSAELPEKYKIRYDAWEAYLKQSPCDSLPCYYDWKNEDITCMHILHNKLRHNRPHTKNDAKYEDSSIYKALLEKLEMQFPILSTPSEELGG